MAKSLKVKHNSQLLPSQINRENSNAENNSNDNFFDSHLTNITYLIQKTPIILLT